MFEMTVLMAGASNARSTMMQRGNTHTSSTAADDQRQREAAQAQANPSLIAVAFRRLGFGQRSRVARLDSILNGLHIWVMSQRVATEAIA